jgi:RNA polymerase sigma-70 factor (ECF subfamily)
VGDGPRMTDADPFERFLLEFQDLVFGTAVRLLGRTAEAEDVSQTVFMKAFEHFDDLRDHPGAAGWLKTVTTRECLNHLSRHRARWRPWSDASDPEQLAAAFVSPDDTLVNADRDARLERALRQLPDHQRVPLVLFHFEHQSYQDIAALLGVSVGKVKTDMHRGRLALRAALGPDEGR